MTGLIKTHEFIELIEKKWTDDKHDYTYFEDRLCYLLTAATCEILILPPGQLNEILQRLNDLLENYNDFPNKYQHSDSFEFEDGCVIKGATYIPGPIFKRLLGLVYNGLRVKVKGGAGIDLSDEIHLKVAFLVRFKFIIETGGKKQNGKKHQSLHPETADKTGSLKTEMKPIFKPDDVQTVFELLKNFFVAEHQSQLYHMLTTGNDANGSLIFLDNGNRLADSFKQLIDADIITGCQKKELENWIFRNFKYRNNQRIKEFTPRYLNDIISTTNDLCRNPILNVTRDRTTGNVLIKRA
jgi:hypothetical protein